MAKRVTDRERLLDFAFRATEPELTDAMEILRSALKAKKGSGPTARARKSRGGRSEGQGTKPTEDTGSEPGE